MRMLQRLSNSHDLDKKSVLLRSGSLQQIVSGFHWKAKGLEYLKPQPNRGRRVGLNRQVSDFPALKVLVDAQCYPASRMS